MINVKETWVVGVSGGPDSMALLDYMRQSGFNVVIAHVNYNKRESSKRDEVIVEKYAENFGLDYEVRYYDESKGGNFQELARDYRYGFYKELVEKYGAKGVVLGHHRDDDVETFYMQKERKKRVMPGMLDEIVIDGLLVWRPLLGKTKADLVAYCDENAMAYGVDESNYELDYTRNKVRHYLTKHNLYDDVYKELVQARENYKAYMDTLVLLPNPFKIEAYGVYALDKRLDMLRLWLNDKALGFHFSDAYIRDLDRYILKGKSQIEIGAFTLSISFGEVMLHGDLSFSYSFEAIEFVETDHFKLCDVGETIEGITLGVDDFPVVFRSYQEGDRIALRYGTKRVNRFFVDRKIPIHRRKSWLVVENRVKEVVFVVKIGCDVYHYSNNPSVFVIE